MHLAQAVEQLGEYVAHEIFGDGSAVFLDEFLQRAPVFILHHHINRIVGTKEIKHADDVRVREFGQCPAFLEKHFMP